jgi:hypothetical protein
MKPIVDVIGRKVLLLSGYRTLLKTGSPQRSGPEPIRIEALEDLRRSAIKNPDAVAFGYVAGRWVPAA